MFPITKKKKKTRGDDTAPHLNCSSCYDAEMTPIEKNARWLVGVMAKHFRNGATSEDLRRQFEKDTTLVRQSYYNALHLVKERGWFVGGGRDRLYHLNSDGSWKEPPKSIGEQLEKEQ